MSTGTGNPNGRPSQFKPEFLAQGCKLAELGATDREIAEFFGVSENTFYRWQHEHAGFRESLKLGKQASDDRVEKSLYRRAIGYSHDAVKIYADPKTGSEISVPYVEHVPPDTTACIFWLKNRRRAEWRDKIEHEHSGEVGHAVSVYIPSNGRDDDEGDQAAAGAAGTVPHDEG